MDTAGCATLETSGRLGGWDHFGRAVGDEQLEDKAEGEGGGWGAGSSDGIFAILYLMPQPSIGCLACHITRRLSLIARYNVDGWQAWNSYCSLPSN